MGNRILFGLVGVALVLGFKFYNKSSASGEVKAHLVTLCAGDTGCQRAVDQHFESCFESSYKMDGRRGSSRIEVGDLVACVNRQAGKEYFVYQRDAK